MSDNYIPGGVISRQDPPPISRGHRSDRTDTNWKLIAQQLRAQPNVWYLCAVGSHALAQHPRIAKGKTENWSPAGSYEATLRNVDGAWHLWIRFVGSAS